MKDDVQSSGPNESFGPDPLIEQRINMAVEEWYSAAYIRGVRVTGIERKLLARLIAQRQGARRG